MTPWLGLAVGLNPGLVYAAAVDTTEASRGRPDDGGPPGVGGRRDGRSRRCCSSCSASPRSRSLAVPAGLAAWSCCDSSRGAPRREVARAPAAARARSPALRRSGTATSGSRSASSRSSRRRTGFRSPFAGWIDTFRRHRALATSGGFFEIAERSGRGPAAGGRPWRRDPHRRGRGAAAANPARPHLARALSSRARCCCASARLAAALSQGPDPDRVFACAALRAAARCSCWPLPGDVASRRTGGRRGVSPESSGTGTAR